METQTWLIRHYKFISAENITIVFVSSDDFLYDFLAVATLFIIYKDELTKFEFPSDYTIYALNMNFVISRRMNKVLTIATH